jgi:DNA invertase Pin-like site-specific DNA recombinase
MIEPYKPRRMVGYIRVSRRMGREGPGYISKDVQREAIQRWADYREVELVRWLEDEDESGGTQDRPSMIEAMRLVENGEADGIACWRLNRFARNVSEALRDVERVQASGGALAFVEEDIDPTGPFGEFILTVLLAVAALELNNVKAGWRTAKEHAIERGVPIGPTPVGYVRVEDGERNACLNVDPVSGPLVREAFVVTGRDGLDACVAFLRENLPDKPRRQKDGTLRAEPMTWTAFTARRFLAQRVYLGEVRCGDIFNARAHEPLVTRAEFEAAQRVMELPVAQRRAKGDFPLSHVAHCGSCGGPLVGGRGGPDARRMYRCASRCHAPVALSAAPLEEHVVAELRAAFDHPGFRVGDDTGDTTAAEAALLEAEQELEAFAADTHARKLLGHRYHPALEQRVAAVDEARQALHDALARSQPTRVVVPAELWDELDASELAEVLRAGLDAVIVARGRRPLAERVRVVPKGMDGVPGVAGTEDPQEGVLQA